MILHVFCLFFRLVNDKGNASGVMGEVGQANQKHHMAGENISGTTTIGSQLTEYYNMHRGRRDGVQNALRWFERYPRQVAGCWVLLGCAAWIYEFLREYILLIGFYLIWAYTRSDTRKPGELSAYSVFNPSQEKIEGTFDAEQFDKGLRTGLGIL